MPVVRNERPASSEGLSNVQESDWLQQKSLRNVPIPDLELAELSWTLKARMFFRHGVREVSRIVRLPNFMATMFWGLSWLAASWNHSQSSIQAHSWCFA